MLKLLLFLLFIFAIFYFRRMLAKSDSDKVTPRRDTSAKPVETMQECVHCGLLVPRSEGIEDQGAFFCCPDHARLHWAGHGR